MGDLDFPERVRRRLEARNRWTTRDASLKPASVLLPFFAPEPDAPPALWLVRRSDLMRVHKGQVALPGGKCEPGDCDPRATALREAEEEIGLPRDDVDVLGVLDDCATVTGFAITPYVGWIATPFTPAPHSAEVARVFAAPLAAFERDPEPITMEWGSSKRIVLSYRAAGETIWGATASILRNFVDVMRGADDPSAS
jgi:8-oxo-dGTP pyrophosphatase MutT (NUDIX family)